MRGGGRDEGVMAHIRLSHGTHMNEPWHTFKYVMAHIRMSHVTQNAVLSDKATVMCKGADLMKKPCHIDK